MQQNGVKPNQKTFLSLIKGYRKQGFGVSWDLVQRMKALNISLDAQQLAAYDVL